VQKSSLKKMGTNAVVNLGDAIVAGIVLFRKSLLAITKQLMTDYSTKVLE